MGIIGFFGKIVAFLILGLVVSLIGASVLVISAPGSYAQIKSDMLEVLPKEMDKMAKEEMPEFTMEELKMACLGPQEDSNVEKICAKVNSGKITTTEQVKTEFYKVMLEEQTKGMDDSIKPKLEEIKGYGGVLVMGFLGLILLSIGILRISTANFHNAFQTLFSMVATISLLSVIGLFLMQQAVPSLIGNFIGKETPMGSTGAEAMMSSMAPYLAKWGLMFVNPVLYAMIGLFAISLIGYLLLRFVYKGTPKNEGKINKKNSIKK